LPPLNLDAYHANLVLQISAMQDPDLRAHYLAMIPGHETFPSASPMPLSSAWRSRLRRIFWPIIGPIYNAGWPLLARTGFALPGLGLLSFTDAASAQAIAARYMMHQDGLSVYARMLDAITVVRDA
jgi:hypothetical protein